MAKIWNSTNVNSPKKLLECDLEDATTQSGSQESSPVAKLSKTSRVFTMKKSEPPQNEGLQNCIKTEHSTEKGKHEL